MRCRNLLRALLLAGPLALSARASAQPTDLYACTSSGAPTCDEVWGPAVLGLPCLRLFDVFIGRIAWYPLRCVGPITIAVESIALPLVQFPLYVEIVPLRESPAPCNGDLGYLVHIVRGVEGGCGGWETSPPIDIAELVPIGSLYAVRLHSFYNYYGHSPAIDCIRITATPTTSRLERVNWGSVKHLYR